MVSRHAEVGRISMVDDTLVGESPGDGAIEVAPEIVGDDDFDVAIVVICRARSRAS